VDLVQDNLPHKTVVFTWHRDVATKMAERLNSLRIPAEAINGDTPMHTRTRYVDRFQLEDEPKVLVATIKTLGESVTLHRAADLIFLESSWTPADMDQAADRVA
jgi:SNF2 family DNA or RNA helicase